VRHVAPAGGRCDRCVPLAPASSAQAVPASSPRVETYRCRQVKLIVAQPIDTRDGTSGDLRLAVDDTRACRRWPHKGPGGRGVARTATVPQIRSDKTR